jgi:hypothetical protein
MAWFSAGHLVAQRQALEATKASTPDRSDIVQAFPFDRAKEPFSAIRFAIAYRALGRPGQAADLRSSQSLLGLGGRYRRPMGVPCCAGAFFQFPMVTTLCGGIQDLQLLMAWFSADNLSRAQPCALLLCVRRSSARQREPQMRHSNFGSMDAAPEVRLTHQAED